MISIQLFEFQGLIIVHAGSLSQLTRAPEQNTATVNVISNTCAHSAMTSQKVCCENDLWLLNVFLLHNTAVMSKPPASKRHAPGVFEHRCGDTQGFELIPMLNHPPCQDVSTNRKSLEEGCLCQMWGPIFTWLGFIFLFSHIVRLGLGISWCHTQYHLIVQLRYPNLSQGDLLKAALTYLALLSPKHAYLRPSSSLYGVCLCQCHFCVSDFGFRYHIWLCLLLFSLP